MRYLPLTFVVGHTTLVVMMAVAIGVLKGESVGLWNFFMLLDFPISVVFARPFTVLENWSRVSLGDEWTYTVVYGAYFVVVGGIQYYFLGWLLKYFATRKERR